MRRSTIRFACLCLCSRAAVTALHAHPHLTRTLHTTTHTPQPQPKQQNVCALLGSLKRGVQHRASEVTLPLSKAGLELARALKAIGAVDDVAVFQKARRLRGAGPAHRYWDPRGAQPAATADVAGLPAMYMRVKLAWKRGAASFSLPGAAGAATAPLTVAAPAPETVRILSRPTAQRVVGLRELLAARRAAPPGIFLLSTPQGLATDVEAELRGSGGVLLAHLGLPLAHVARVRGALRGKHLAEEAAAAAAAAEGRPPPPRVPLHEWDMGAAALAAVAPRVHAPEALAAARGVLGRAADDAAARGAVLSGMQERMMRLALERAAWQARGEIGGGGDEDGGGDDGGYGSGGYGSGGGSRRLPGPEFGGLMRRQQRGGGGGERGGRGRGDGGGARGG